MSMADRVTLTLRIDRHELARLHEEYYATIADHRMSFNAWICALLAECMAEPEPA